MTDTPQSPADRAVELKNRISELDWEIHEMRKVPEHRRNPWLIRLRDYLRCELEEPQAK
jgi:hypothetical protein